MAVSNYCDRKRCVVPDSQRGVYEFCVVVAREAFVLVGSLVAQGEIRDFGSFEVAFCWQISGKL